MLLEISFERNSSEYSYNDVATWFRLLVHDCPGSHQQAGSCKTSTRAAESWGLLADDWDFLFEHYLSSPSCYGPRREETGSREGACSEYYVMHA